MSSSPHVCRRLPALVAPALEPDLAALLASLAAAFPPVEACLAASGMSACDASAPLSGSRSGVGDLVDLGAPAGSDSESEGEGARFQGVRALFLSQSWALRHVGDASLHAE